MAFCSILLDGSTVRGGFALKHQEFCFSRCLKPAAFYHFPLSEGIVDKKYVNVGVQMLRKAFEENPLLFALGMGGFEYPLPRMLKALGWKMAMVPFYFRVVKPFQFLRGMAELRKSALRRVAADLAALTGLGSMGIRAGQTLRSKSREETKSLKTIEVEEFGDWADAIWGAAAPKYAMVGDRSRDALRLLYPRDNKQFLRVRVDFDGTLIGWLLLLTTQMQNDRHFGNLRVASIVDCLATPENAEKLICAARHFLRRRNIDIIVSNQSHAAWTAALRANGFFEAPSNCVFAASPKMAELLDPFEEKVAQVHLNRGDGDGPIHL